MTRRKFWLLGGGAVLAAGAATEWLVERRPAGPAAPPADAAHPAVPLLPDEQAPSCTWPCWLPAATTPSPGG